MILLTIVPAADKKYRYFYYLNGVQIFDLSFIE